MGATGRVNPNPRRRRCCTRRSACLRSPQRTWSRGEPKASSTRAAGPRIHARAGRTDVRGRPGDIACPAGHLFSTYRPAARNGCGSHHPRAQPWPWTMDSIETLPAADWPTSPGEAASLPWSANAMEHADRRPLRTARRSPPRGGVTNRRSRGVLPRRASDVPRLRSAGRAAGAPRGRVAACHRGVVAISGLVGRCGVVCCDDRGRLGRQPRGRRTGAGAVLVAGVAAAGVRRAPDRSDPGPGRVDRPALARRAAGGRALLPDTAGCCAVVVDHGGARRIGRGFEGRLESPDRRAACHASREAVGRPCRTRRCGLTGTTARPAPPAHWRRCGAGVGDSRARARFGAPLVR